MDGTTQGNVAGRNTKPLTPRARSAYYLRNNIRPTLASTNTRDHAFQRHTRSLSAAPQRIRTIFQETQAGSKLSSWVRPFSHATPAAIRDYVPCNVQEVGFAL